MRVLAREQPDVQRDGRLAHEGEEELLHKLGIERAHLLRGQGRVKAEAGPAAEVYGHKREHLVHGQEALAVAPHAPLIAQGGAQRLPQRDADVLHGMVVVHLRIARAAHAQVKAGMGGKEGEHVVQKAAAGADVALSRAVEVQGEGNVGLGGFALDGRASHDIVLSDRMARVSSTRRRICSRVPMVMRTCSLSAGSSQQRMSTPRALSAS